MGYRRVLRVRRCGTAWGGAVRPAAVRRGAVVPPRFPAMPFRLPIFPLSVVLFPGTPLPLHIFEPRYRKMLADCLAGDRRFGITPAGKDDVMPEPGTVGCIAEVRVNQELPDGRSNVIVFARLRP